MHEAMQNRCTFTQHSFGHLHSIFVRIFVFGQFTIYFSCTFAFSHFRVAEHFLLLFSYGFDVLWMPYAFEERIQLSNMKTKIEAAHEQMDNNILCRTLIEHFQCLSVCKIGNTTVFCIDRLDSTVKLWTSSGYTSWDRSWLSSATSLGVESCANFSSNTIISAIDLPRFSGFFAHCTVCWKQRYSNNLSHSG